MRIALTRHISPAMADCELSHIERLPIDLSLAASQHAAYVDALRVLGCLVIELAAEPAFPDSVFVEDSAIVLDEIALITRPGASSRQGECASIAAALAPYRRLLQIEAPGTVDGGDVLRIGKVLYVGASGRSNADAVAQMRDLLKPFGYRVEYVPIRGCLHLKSAVSEVADGSLLVQPEWIDAQAFAGHRIIEVDPREPHAANALRIGDGVIYPDCFPATRERLRAVGIEVCAVDVGELQKAEGAVTCCSIVFSNQSGASTEVSAFP